MGSEVEPPQIVQTLASRPEDFLKPTVELHADVLESAKRFLDPVASGISHEQQTRRKRKRGNSTSDRPSQPLRLQEIHVNGFTPQQVWEQARRVLKSCSSVTAKDAAIAKAAAVGSSEASISSERDQADDDDGGDGEMLGEEELEALEDVGADQDDSAADSGIPLAEDIGDEERDEEEEEDDDDNEGLPADNSQTAFHPDRFGLNDGFFSIDEFNKQTAFFEHQDNKGGANDNDEDDEAVDWDADPFGDVGSDEEEEDEALDHDLGEEIDEGDDLDVLHGGGDDEMSTEDKAEDPRNIRYEEFFDPPALNTSHKKKTSKQNNKPQLLQAEDEVDDEVGRAMADVRRDLFDDESDEEDGDGSDMDGDVVDLKGLSTHEQRRAKLAAEMRKLEAANVAKKDWTVAGEARAADRPHNALLEEQLEFEHVGKPVPVITAEVTDDIEAQIKQRIIAKEFDEVVRRNPLAVAEQQRGSRKGGKFELDDSKPQQGLAELYEADHMRATDPGYVDVKDAKLKKEHEEIKQLWNNIRSQLDTLSNWHYKPKTPALNINVVEDVDTIQMEDVRPTGEAGGAVTSARLAPQEVYAPGDDGKNRGEVLPQSGAAVAKDEMSRRAKLRRRRREKQKLKKAGQSAAKPEGAAAQKQQVVSELKKGDVKVIGKGGRLSDVQGREAGSSGVKDRRTALKL